MNAVARVAFVVVLAFTSMLGACAPGPVDAHARAADPTPRLEDSFDGDPALLVVLRPTKLAEDPLYGPLVRRVSQLASTRAAMAEAVGTTTLAALERTQEVIIGAYDKDARSAVIALRGVPADVDATRVLDTNGKPLWSHVRDLPFAVEELAPVDPNADAALFVLPRRAWVIAVGGAVEHARHAYVEATHSSPRLPAALDDGLLFVRLRGDALLEARPSLANGALAPIVRDLDLLSVTLEPGPQGSVGELVARLEYGSAVFAQRANGRANDVVAAFTRKYDRIAPWLHAVTVAQEDRSVVVRGRIPRAWADGLLHVDLGDLAK